jgi:hypothetical protein
MSKKNYNEKSIGLYLKKKVAKKLILYFDKIYDNTKKAKIFIIYYETRKGLRTHVIAYRFVPVTSEKIIYM